MLINGAKALIKTPCKIPTEHETRTLYLSCLKEPTVVMVFCSLIVFLSLWFGHCTADSMHKSSAEWTMEKATSVCSEVQKTDSSLLCFAACVSQSIYFYSFSRSRDTRSCYCCVNPPSGSGSVVPDQGMINYKTCTYIS